MYNLSTYLYNAAYTLQHIDDLHSHSIEYKSRVVSADPDYQIRYHLSDIAMDWQKILSIAADTGDYFITAWLWGDSNVDTLIMLVSLPPYSHTFYFRGTPSIASDLLSPLPLWSASVHDAIVMRAAFYLHLMRAVSSRWRTKRFAINTGFSYYQFFIASYWYLPKRDWWTLAMEMHRDGEVRWWPFHPNCD